MNNKKNIKMVKEIVERLVNISLNEDFIFEVLDALKSDEERELFKNFLEQNSELVQSEVYDALGEITEERFVKELPITRALKQKYLKNKSKETLQELLNALSTNGVLMLFEWDLTSDEEKLIKSSEIGERIHIESPMIPLMYESEDENIIIPVYTSSMEIFKEEQQKYAVQEVGIKYLKNVIQAVEKILEKEVFLLLDFETDTELKITEDMLRLI